MNPVTTTRLLCRGLFVIMSVALSLGGTLRLSAGSFVWDGGGGNNNWSTANNWNPNGAPAAGTLNDYTFATNTRTTNTADGATLWEVNSLTFNNTSGAFTLSGTGLKLYAGGVTNNDTQLQTINNTIALQATATFNANSGSLALGGVVSGAFGITKTGANTLTLSGANTYTGATTVNAGTLKAGVASVANTSGAFGNNSAVTLANVSGAILDITGFNTQIGSLTGGGATGGNVTLGAATLTVGGDNTSPAAYAGSISGTGSLTKIGSGTLTLSGTNGYTGTTTISAGTLSISADANLGGTSGPLSLNGGTLNTSANLTLNAGRTFTVGASGGTLDVDAGTTLTYNGVLAGTGALTKNDTGTFISGGASGNTLTGAVTINAGVFEIAKTAFVGGIDNAAAVTVASGATLRFNGGATYTQETIGSLTGAGTVTNVGAGAVNLVYGNNTSNTFSGILTDTTNDLNVVKNGTGTFTLSGNNSYDGTTLINAGALNIQSNTALGTATNGTSVTATGAALELQNNITVTGETLSLTGTGVTNNGALRNISGANTWTGNVTLTGATEIQSDAGSLAISGGVTSTNLGLTVDTAASSSVALSGAVALGSGGITKNSAGTLTLSGNNTYTGTTTVNAGTLFANGTNSLGATSANITVAGGTLSLAGGAAVTVGSPTNAETITHSGTLSLSGSGATAATGALHAGGSTGQTSQYIGNITLAGNATISAADNLLIVGNGSYTNTLALGANTLTFNTTAAASVTPIYLPSSGFILDPTNILFNSAISGSGGIVKDGTGTVTIISYPSNSYTGSTVINDGKLIIGGPNNLPVISSSSVTVGNSTGTADSAVLQMGFLNSGFAAKNYQIGTASGSAATTSMLVNSDGLFNLNGGNNALVGLTLAGGHVDMGAGYSNLLTLTGSLTSTASSQTALIEHGNIGLSANSFAVTVASGTTSSGVDLQINSIVQNGIGYTGGTSGTSLAKKGTGTLVLAGANTYDGITDVQAGVLNIRNNLALGQSTAGTVVQAGAQLQLDGSSGNLTIAAEALTLNGNGTSATGDLRNVAGANTYNGFITLGGDSRINADTGSTLNIASTSGTGATIINGSAANRVLTVGGAGDININSVIGSNVGTLVKDGAGTVTLAGDYSAHATTTVNNGTLALNMGAGGLNAASATVTIGDHTGSAGSATVLLQQSNQIADTATVRFDSDGRLNVNGKTETVGSIASVAGGTGSILLGNGTLSAGGTNASTTYAGTLQGTGSSIFNKEGTGALTFSSNLNAAAGDFAGTMNLNAGSIIFTASSDFTNNGLVTTDTLNVAAGTTLKLSDAILKFTHLNFTGHGTITLDFSGASSKLYTDFLNLQFSDTLISIINWANAADFFYATNWTGAVLDVTGSSPMNQVNFNSPWTGANTKWQGYDDQITPVPEPSTYGALLLGAMGAMLGWRRHRAAKRGKNPASAAKA